MSAVGRNGSAIGRPPPSGTAATMRSSTSATSISPGRARGAVEAGEAGQRLLVLRRRAAEDEAEAVGDRAAARAPGGAGAAGGGVAVGGLGGGDGGIEGLHGVSPLFDLRHDSILGYAALPHIGRMVLVSAALGLTARRPTP